MILHGAEPFFLAGSKKGILLVHGFTGSPSEMLLLGKYLNYIGYTVMAVRLCGHGTNPEDMARMKWRDWYASVCDGYHLLKNYCKDIYIIGLSMGGALSLLLSIDFPVKKAASLSTPIFIAAQRGLDMLPPRHLSNDIYIPKIRHLPNNIPAVCNVGYKKMPLICVHELLDCIQYLKKNLKRVKVPVLVVQSSNDHTVDNKSGRYIYNKIESQDKQFLQLSKSGHLVILDTERKIVFERIKQFLAK
ncbi:alpha/beta hydrolase [Pectinatus frisingensis]|jgi:carboxylesterase|uniref:alpha/beta hydrolase n=1 Tax=Pectinatus frisingensis TaxID=865 RepID=UPI0015F6A0F1|nr:alpha/beta fold hydrolase [Pectinatus frisingensis]